MDILAKKCYNMFGCMNMATNCSICDGSADETFSRKELWRNDRWRLTFSTYKDVFGFCYLGPIRHIRYVTELDGREADEFGTVLSHITSALRAATGAKLVYVYIYGDHIPHLHVHLAPHMDGDPFNDEVVKAGVNLSDETVDDEVARGFVRSVRNFLLTSI